MHGGVASSRRGRGRKTVQVVLQDPIAHEDAPLVIDRGGSRKRGPATSFSSNELRHRRRDATIRLWIYNRSLFRERWIVRDVAICALVLGFISLTPILFWRVLSDKVLYYKVYDTFFVICIVMAVFIASRPCSVGCGNFWCCL